MSSGEPSGRDGKVGLVTGAHGIVGYNLVEHLAGSDGWTPVASGRRARFPLERVRYVPADLCDRDATVAAFSGLGDVTHLFFAAYQIRADLHEEVDVNVAMLTNALDALEAAGAPLRHVTLYQGGKAYGAHLGPFRTPAKESDPRLMGPLFYYAQEDIARALADAGRLTFTVLRPDHICGIGFGPFVNLVQAIGVYASICKELGLALCFPGTEASYHALVQATDARLLARASAWAATAPTAANQVFNVTNGDTYRFSMIWPAIAEAFAMPVGPPMNYPLRTYMADKASVWQRLVERHGLQPIPYGELVNWVYADAILKMEHDIHTSTVKIRKAGFHDCLDTEEAIIDLIDEMRTRKILPPA